MGIFELKGYIPILSVLPILIICFENIGFRHGKINPTQDQHSAPHRIQITSQPTYQSHQPREKTSAVNQTWLKTENRNTQPVE